VWTHSTSLASLTLASAFAGVLLHKLLLQAFVAAETQRQMHLDARRALRHRERLLRHAMRVETVGDLAGLVTHQLRNAFQVMMGHATLGSMGDDAERTRRLALVIEELANSRPLLDQLMSLAHPEEGEAAVKDLDVEVRAFFQRAERIMPANVRLVLESCQLGLSVLINPRGLEHALWNLVINARQAMPEGGTITLRTATAGDRAQIVVADTGSGIPAAIRARVFDPYFTTKPPGQGTGLGLAAVDRFVRASNGTIRLDSEVGSGTSFALDFPLLRAPVQRTA
jgi:signal transduction histidine kinase